MKKQHQSVLLYCVLFLIWFFIPYTSVEGADRNDKINYPAYMQGIDYGNGPIYVIGHRPPDSDSVCTAIAYANLKRKLGINAEARITSAINAETAYALKYFDFQEPPLLDNAASKNIILVDHNSFAQAVSGMDKANILEIIDHHNFIGDVKTAAPAYYRNLPIGCTSTIVWLEYREANVPIEKGMAGMMLSVRYGQFAKHHHHGLGSAGGSRPREKSECQRQNRLFPRHGRRICCLSKYVGQGCFLFRLQGIYRKWHFLWLRHGRRINAGKKTGFGAATWRLGNEKF